MSTPPGRWEVTPEFPEGRFVPLTPEELAILKRDQAEAVISTEREVREDVSRRTIQTRLTDRLPALQAARDAVTANPPTLFANASNQERVLIRNIINTCIGLTRLANQLLESAD